MRALAFVLLLAGCVAPKDAARIEWRPVQLELGASVWSVTIEGHAYLFAKRGNGAGFVHSASCAHPSHR